MNDQKDFINSTFLITGGSGRVITSIPALEKYHKLNPHDDFKVIVSAWDSVFWSHPTLQHRVFEQNQKGLFLDHVKNYNLKVPEPYTYHKFYNEQINLIDCFDELINSSNTQINLNKTNFLYLSTNERTTAQKNIKYYKEFKKVDRVIVFQPYGSTSFEINNQVVDDTSRSMSVQNYFDIVKRLSKHTAIVYMGPKPFRHVNDDISIYFDDSPTYLRDMMSLISESDYFLGIDSVGQHIAKAFNKKGLIVMGGTNENIFSYPDHFKIYRKKGSMPVYAPWRISDTDTNFSYRRNDGMMQLKSAEIDDICNIVISGLK